MISSVAKLLHYNPPPGIRVISVDLFDTVLIRRVDPPETTKALAARHAVSRLSLDISAVELHSRRLAAERDLRRKAEETGGDGEYSLPELYRTLSAAVPALQDAQEKLLPLEMEVEEALSLAMPAMAELLARLREKYRVVAISDTYLPAPLLQVLLEKAGLAHLFDAVYASCDHGCNKGSGKLFEKVLEIEGHSRSEWLHIGDNFLSDYFIPRSLGITSVLLRDPANQGRKVRQSALNRMSQRSSLGKADELLGALVSTLPADAAGGGKARLREWGAKTVAPPVLLFVHELCLRLSREPRRKVYFLAREGYLLKRLYEIFNRELYAGKLPQGNYLCISRATAFPAALFEVGEREIELALQDHSVQLRDVLRRFGIDDAADTDWIWREYAVSPSLSDKVKMREVLRALGSDQRFSSLVATKSAVMRQMLEAYLEEEGFFAAEEVALVDVGWQGSIQDYLERFLSRRGGGPKLHGYYLGVEYNSSCDYANKSGLLHDFRKPTVDGTCLTFFRLAFEFSLRGGHGTTTGYRLYREGSCRPLFRNDPNEKRCLPQIRAIQEGILDFAKGYVAMARVERFQPHDLASTFLKYHNRRISFPDRETLAAFSPVIHTEDHATDNYRSITGRIQLAALAAPGSLFNRFIEIPWRESALKGLNIPFLLTLYYLYKKALAARLVRAALTAASGGNGTARTFPEAFRNGAYLYQLFMLRGASMATGFLVNFLDLLPVRLALYTVHRLIAAKAAMRRLAVLNKVP